MASGRAATREDLTPTRPPSRIATTPNPTTQIGTRSGARGTPSACATPGGTVGDRTGAVQNGAMSPQDSLAPDEPALERRTAVVGRRVAQFAIDYLLTGLVPAAGLTVFLLADTDPDGGVNANGRFWIITALYLAVAIGWTVWMWISRPLRNDGQTYGMRLLGLRIERIDGGPLTAGPLVVRTILLIVDLFASGLVGLITMIATRHHQRVGDLAANTVVVRASA